MAPTCILAAREHQLTRSLKRTVDPEFEVVAMVDNPVSLRNSIEALGPDLVVVYLELLGPDAGKILHVIGACSPHPPVIGLSPDLETTIDPAEIGCAAIVPRQLAGSQRVPAARQLLPSG